MLSAAQMLWTRFCSQTTVAPPPLGCGYWNAPSEAPTLFPLDTFLNGSRPRNLFFFFSFFSTFLLLLLLLSPLPPPTPPYLPPQCHLCYIIQRESCASETNLTVGEDISPGRMEVVFQPTNQIVTLSMYDSVLFYPSNECMSTECPVTSLL